MHLQADENKMETDVVKQVSMPQQNVVSMGCLKLL